MKKILVGLFVMALVMVFVVPETQADYPYGFDKIKEICDMSGEIMPGMKGVELRVPDTSPGNYGGMTTLLAANGENVIAVGMILRSSEGDPFIGVTIIHSHADGENVIIDLLTKEEHSIEGGTIGLFITEWLRLYNKAMGTPV